MIKSENGDVKIKCNTVGETLADFALIVTDLILTTDLIEQLKDINLCKDDNIHNKLVKAIKNFFLKMEPIVKKDFSDFSNKN